MKRKILLFFILCFSFFCLVADFGYCATKGHISITDLSKKTGNKLLNMGLLDYARESGSFFMLVRNNNKTRDLQWVLFDPMTQKVLKSGDCPFKLENDVVAVSPDGKHAALFSRVPTVLWLLDTESGKWDKIMENPKVDEAGLTIIRKVKVVNGFGTSYLKFVDNSTVATCLQDLDKNKNMKDIFPSFVNVDKKEIEPFVSFSEMLIASSKILESKAEGNCFIDNVYHESNNSLLFTIRNDKHSYIMRIGKDKVAHIVHTFPVRHIAISDVCNGNIVCRISIDENDAKKSITVIKNDGTMEVLVKSRPVYGFAVENDSYVVSSFKANSKAPLVELIDSNGKHFSIAQQDEVSIPYIDKKPSIIYFVNENGIKYFKIMPKNVKVKK